MTQELAGAADFATDPTVALDNALDTGAIIHEALFDAINADAYRAAGQELHYVIGSATVAATVCIVDDANWGGH